ncbi:MAG: acyl-CoA dehydrogenase family protein [Chloroflexota bacterium]
MNALPPRMQDKLYHDVFLPEETRGVRQEARSFAQKEVEPRAHEIGSREEAVEHFPREVFTLMGQQGLFGLGFPTRYGGRGLQYPMSATTVAIEELAYASNAVAAIYDVHCILAGHALLYGSEELRQHYLRPLIAGDRIAAFAVTEPEAGSDLSPDTVQTVAERKNGGWVVSGRKRFIINAPVADFAVTLCLTEGKLSMLALDLKADGVYVGEPDRKTGIKGCLTADLAFDDVFVAEQNLVGQQGKGLRVALSALTCGRIAVGATGVGMAQAAFDEAAAYLSQRRAFGRPVAGFQHWQFEFAKIATQIENARNLCYKSALRHDSGVEFPEPEVAMAKQFGTEVGVDTAGVALQAFGGYGYMTQLGADGSTYKVEQIYRDAATARIYEGTNEIQKWLIARQIFGASS